VSVFYLAYILFEIPGAIIVERWSARKWIARILISWGIVTILTGFVRTTAQFYTARFFLGLAEASFFPGMIVYLTHWFCARDRGRAIACMYTAVPTASLIGAPIAGWLLGVHWCSLAGWRWLFILEGVPAILLGIVTFFYLTDWPNQARWLPENERQWLTDEMRAELQAKKKARDYTILQAFCDKRVVFLSSAWFLAAAGYLGTVYWIPVFVKRLSGFSDQKVTALLIIPALIAITGMLINGWHSDKNGERRWHAASPLLFGAFMFAAVTASHHNFVLAISFLLLGSGLLQTFYPIFWSIPTSILSESAAAATFGLINSMGQVGGFIGPYVIGFLNDKTHSLNASFTFIVLVYLAAAILILSLKLADPIQRSEGARVMSKSEVS
jgi:MFS transporter, ACS family, tartrate transporter